MKLHPYVKWFKHDLAYKAPETWPAHLAQFFIRLTECYPNADEVEDEDGVATATTGAEWWLAQTLIRGDASCTVGVLHNGEVEIGYGEGAYIVTLRKKADDV